MMGASDSDPGSERCQTRKRLIILDMSNARRIVCSRHSILPYSKSEEVRLLTATSLYRFRRNQTFGQVLSRRQRL